MKDRTRKIRKDCLGHERGSMGKKGRNKRYVRLYKKCVQLRKKRSALERVPRLLGREVGNYAVTTPTTTAAKAPRALSTLLDPPLVLVLVVLLEELEGFEPLEVLLGVPELDPPELGVAEGSG